MGLPKKPDPNGRLRMTLAAVITKHYVNDPPRSIEGWSATVADAIIDALRLEVDRGVIVGFWPMRDGA